MIGFALFVSLYYEYGKKKYERWTLAQKMESDLKLTKVQKPIHFIFISFKKKKGKTKQNKQTLSEKHPDEVNFVKTWYN